MKKAQKNLPWKIEPLSKNCHRLIFKGVKSGWEGWLLLMSDEHWDNAHCDLALLKRHHEEAKERGAAILKFGDVFCAMQGKWDKRADQNDLRPEHRGNNYLDRLKDTAAKWYAPYAENIALLTPGNHEGSILQRHQTDLIGCLARDLRVQTGAYSGFVIIQFEFSGRRTTNSKQLHYHHGYGGGGEVTRGLIDNSRTRGQYLADIYYSGHIHRRNMDENILTECTPAGLVRQRPQLFLRGSAYKSEGNDGNGWHVAQGRSGRPLGGWWLRFHYTPKGHNRLIETEAMSAG